MAGEAKRPRADEKLYILGHKIQKKRYECLVNAAKKKGFDVVYEFSPQVTHVVSELETRDKVLTALKIEDSDLSCDAIEVLNMTWFTQCMRQGHSVPVQPEHRLQVAKMESEASEEAIGVSTQYACQRAAPLHHHNLPLTKALEILERNAQFHETDEQYSRALAFRRGSAVLKSLKAPLTSLSQVKGLKDIGRHCFKVIKEVFEDGYSEEVEEIERSSWFQKMKLFTCVFGVGPATANKWISQGVSTINDAMNMPDVHRREDPRIGVGLAFYSDLTLPVTRREADCIRNIVKCEAEAVLPGIRVELGGGFKRGKETGHDVDLLLSHPNEGDEHGLLAQLLTRLQHRDLILFGRQEKSTYSDEVLHNDSKLAYLRGGLDHFEKWIGILKVDKSFRSAKVEDRACNSQTTDSCVEAESSEVKEQPGTSLKQTMDSYESPKSLFVKQSSLRTYSKEAEMARDWHARRVDLIVVPASQYYYALVGWIGGKHFNRSLRLYAQRELNMKLTSHGLYDCNQVTNNEVFSVIKVINTRK